MISRLPLSVAPRRASAFRGAIPRRRPPFLRAVLLLSALVCPGSIPSSGRAQEAPSPAALRDEPAASSALDIEVGTKYAAGTRVRQAATGVSWIVPADWLGGMPPESPAFLMGSETEAGLGIAYILSNVTAEDVAAKLAETQALDESLVLEPVGEPKISGNRVALSYEGELFDGQALALVGPAAQGVVYFFAGPKELAGHYAALLEKLAASTKFTAPEAPKPAPVAAAGKGGVRAPGPWNDLLAGMMLKQLSSYSSGTSGGYNSSRVWHLCSDGSYAYQGSSSVSIDAGDYSGSSSGQGGSQGRWSVEVSGADAVLVLESDAGETYRLSLQYDGEKTFLDGERVFRVPSDGCR